MRATEWQVVVEKGIEDIGPVKERRPIVEAEIVAGRVVFRSVLHCADIVERLGARVVQIEHQPVPVIVAQGDDECVVVGMVVAIAHEKIENLQVVIRRQPQGELSIYIYRVEQAGNVVVYEVDGIARSNTGGRGNVGLARAAANSEARELIFEPGLIRDRTGSHTRSKLSRDGVIRLRKDLTGGLVFEHVRRGVK